jgi:hypothetical protein
MTLPYLSSREGRSATGTRWGTHPTWRVASTQPSVNPEDEGVTGRTYPVV